MSTATSPLESLSFDLVVIGGGLAGLCAAIAAARENVRVALIQERSVLGGNASSEVRVVAHGANIAHGWAGETGLIHELLLRDRAANHECFFDHGMVNALYDFNLLEAARAESNLTLFLNTTVRSVESAPIDPNAPSTGEPTPNGLGRIGGEPRRIHAVFASQLGSEREFRVEARQFIDATGDGTVGFLAGADFRYGREGRDEFNEPLAPAKSDDVTMGSTITMRAKDIGQEVPFTPPAWAADYRRMEDIGFKRSIYHVSKPLYGGYWWLEVCNPFHQIRDNAEIRHELHRHVLGVWNFIKNHSDFRDQARRHVLDWIGMVPGKRESRRLVGDVLLTEHDVQQDPQWPDAIGFAGWWIDLHIKGGILNKKDPGERENADRNYKHWIRVAPFTVPLRCFYSRNVENLWMAGRCLSTTHVALGPVRVMQSLAQMGQAVGSAAAYALNHGLTPRETAAPDGPHMAGIQQRLLRDDVRILGVRNTDPADLALTARATASSDAPLDLSRVDAKTWFLLGANPPPKKHASPALGIVLPLSAPHLDRAEVYVRNVSGASQSLTARLEKVGRIWERHDQPILAEVPVTVPASHEGWLELPFGAAVEPGHSYRVSLHGGEGVEWAACADWPVGTLLHYRHECPGGPEPKNAHLGAYAPEEVTIPAYRHWRPLRAAVAARVFPESRPFAADNVTNGFAWPERMPNLWISDPAAALPQHVELRWDTAQTIATVEVSFDTNLSRLSQSAEPFFRAPEAAKDWRVLVETAPGTWTEVFRDGDNISRKRRATFAPVTTSALRLEVLATNGDASARVFEVRAYAPES